MNVEDAYYNFCRAEKDMKKALEKTYPAGSTVDVELKSGQVNLSEMTVLCHRNDGHICCEMYTKDKWYPDKLKRYTRDVFFKNIHGVQKPASCGGIKE